MTQSGGAPESRPEPEQHGAESDYHPGTAPGAAPVAGAYTAESPTTQLPPVDRDPEAAIWGAPTSGPAGMPDAGRPTSSMPTSEMPTSSMPTSGLPHGYPAPGTPAPGSGAPYGGQASAPPYGQPSYGQPPYGQPPYGPTPYAQAPNAQPAPARRRGILTPILATIATLLLLATGAMTALYLSESSAHADAKRTIKQRDTAIAGKTTELEAAKRQLQTANDGLAKTKTDLTGSQNQAVELKRQRDVISKCLTLIVDIAESASNGDRAAVTRKQAEVTSVCEEAERYME